MTSQTDNETRQQCCKKVFVNGSKTQKNKVTVNLKTGRFDNTDAAVIINLSVLRCLLTIC